MFVEISLHASGRHKFFHGVYVLRLQVQREVREVVTPFLDVPLGHVEDLDLVSSLLLHGAEQLLLVLGDVGCVDRRECGAV